MQRMEQCTRLIRDKKINLCFLHTSFFMATTPPPTIRIVTNTAPCCYCDALVAALEPEPVAKDFVIVKSSEQNDKHLTSVPAIYIDDKLLTCGLTNCIKALAATFDLGEVVLKQRADQKLLGTRWIREKKVRSLSSRRASTMNRLGVIGWGGYTGAAHAYLIKTVLTHVLGARPTIDILVSGGWRGPDSVAEDYAKEHGLGMLVFHPKTEDDAGYTARNEQIGANCDMMAFTESRAAGTAYTVGVAERHDVDLLELDLSTMMEMDHKALLGAVDKGMEGWR